MKRFLHDHGLTIVNLALFVVFLLATSLTGMREYNHDREDHSGTTIGYVEYMGTGHFLETTAENWESEFLQMAFYVFLTTMLFQRGSAESKDPDRKEPVDRDPRTSRKTNAPWPVHRGGWILRLYENSLSIALFSLFFMSFLMHARGGAIVYSEEQLEHGGSAVTMAEYMTTSRFWFESFQNWQSEFLAVAAIVWLSVYLRQRGSPESKPVDTPHHEMGE